MLRTKHHDNPEPTTRANRHALDQRQSSQQDTSRPLTEGSTAGPKDDTVSKVEIPQHRRRAILAVWAAAALPMAALAWLVAPAAADRLSGDGNLPMVKALTVCLMVGLIWQFVLVMALVHHEQRSLRWSTLREALWLRSPRSPRSGRIGGRIWLVLIPLVLAFALANLLIPTFGAPDSRDLGSFLGSDAGQSFFSGNWGWFAILVVLWIFNGILGEELLFRVPPAPHERRLRAGRLGRERRPLRGVSPAHSVADSSDPARHVHPLVPDEAVSERLDRDRRAQLAERVHWSHRPRTCSLSKNIRGRGDGTHERRSVRTVHARTNSRPHFPEVANAT